MASVHYKGFGWELTEAEYDALSDYGPDVACGQMTSDEAVYAVLMQSVHAKRVQIPRPDQDPPSQLWAC